MDIANVVVLPIDGKQHVVLTMICDSGHVMGQWLDSIAEKYPNCCDECECSLANYKYPWIVKSQIVQC